VLARRGERLGEKEKERRIEEAVIERAR